MNQFRATALLVLLAPTHASFDEWPGGQEVWQADKKDAFDDNLSGVYYEARGDNSNEDIIWSVQNRPSELYQLQYSTESETWNSVTSWRLHYADGDGDPDAEDLTKAELDSANIYVSTEQNNDDKESRLSVLLFREDETASELHALQEWDLTADLKSVDHNEGLEAITWIPDSFLVQGGLVDDSQGGALYDPSMYPDHGSGLFFVGLEDNGKVYGYALTHDPAYAYSPSGSSPLLRNSSTLSTSSYTRITSLSSGLKSVMSLHFDDHSSSSSSEQVGHLWTVCDNNCKGHSIVYTLPAGGNGKFTEVGRYERPDDMPNINNEGFTPAPDKRCDEASNRKAVYWCDDSCDGGHALRGGTMPCGDFLASGF
mmetsp:Transcript_11739/g.19121  ORF Transcript_11739/g.19121 Transcript_11739/m.19121 type:complete len:369 (+) Transcript_11739:63-1169(+)|eukprot:CAMPEP_0114428254 /NCGR_PEP_ID=MMETSP0103-20121206/8825_1 /TAXON_ID=37642 ORGANISM="Paraphysomonas imperforata, Strain PA2" /NCGR_SAMPLE_ID=MMETSP0103 /ASSEMBLY_ACC=CAM_ASM_000201 /LENGTH=368 /DNA_ID=CAMNT_0001597453 /DNA_START=37 /DNA_END=1143 /DNA_ORIENTATION=+